MLGATDGVPRAVLVSASMRTPQRSQRLHLCPDRATLLGEATHWTELSLEPSRFTHPPFGVVRDGRCVEQRAGRTEPHSTDSA